MPDFNHLYIGGLVKKAQQDDSDAFAELYALTYQHIYQYSYRYLRNPDTAQDAVQEVYILALKNISKLKDPSLFVAWLNQIAFRVCFGMCKAQNSNYDEISPQILELSPDEYMDHNPESRMLKSDQTQSLKRAIQQLSFCEQQAIVMKYLNEMKIDDIAKSMQCSRSSVKRYIENGKIHLHEALQHETIQVKEVNS